MAIGFPARYEMQIPLNGLSPALFLHAAQRAFHKLNWEVTEKTDLNLKGRTPFSFASWNEVVTLRIENDYAVFTSTCGTKQVIDWGKNKANYFSFMSAFSPADSLDESDTSEEIVAETITEEEPMANFSLIDAFKPRQGFVITPILLYVNVLIFLLMVFSGVGIFEPDTTSLVNWGANFAPVTLEGEWWRLFTSCFLHIGILHLVFNMYALLYIGIMLEPLIGSVRFAIVYLLTGIAASAASLYWNDYVVSAGASGAIFGLYGVFLALLLFKVVSAQVRQQLLTSIMLFVGFNLLYGINDGIDNAAHIGGLLTGFAFALGMVPFFKSTTQSNLQTYVLLGQSVLILAICQVIYFGKDNVAATYDAKLAEFGKLEDKALDILRYADESDIPALQRKITIEGVALWEKAHQLIADLQDLDLPEQLYAQNLRFMGYCNLRIKSYRCIATSLTDTTGIYEDSIVYYQRTIDELFLQPE